MEQMNDNMDKVVKLEKENAALRQRILILLDELDFLKQENKIQEQELIQDQIEFAKEYMDPYKYYGLRESEFLP